MKKFLLLALCTVSISNSWAKKIEVSLGKIKLMNDMIEILIPTHFNALLDHEIKSNYSPDNLPKVAYGDSLRTSRLAFFTKKSEVSDPDVNAMKASAITEFLRNDLKMKQLENDQVIADNLTVSYVEILHKSPEKFYRLYFLTVFKGMILAGELVVPKKVYKSWLPVGKEIMQSVDIKGN